MSCQQEAIERLQESGSRLTPQRAMVLEALFHGDGHLTAEEVHGLVQATSPFVDLSTIYRTLQFLKQQGLAGEIRLDGQPVRYEANRAGHEHHHAICTSCGAMVDVDPEDLQLLVQALQNRYGFQVYPVHLTLYGTCADCSGP